MYLVNYYVVIKLLPCIFRLNRENSGDPAARDCTHPASLLLNRLWFNVSIP